MPLQSDAVSVTDEATRLDTTIDYAPGLARSLIFWVADGDTVYFGGSDVTVANGGPVTGPSWSPAVEIDAGGVYGIVAEADSPVSVRVVQANA